jgi:hypothetical protein
VTLVAPPGSPERTFTTDGYAVSLARLAALALVLCAACYTEDQAGLGDPVARVLLTDAPFPYDSVARVEIYVVRVEATGQPDTSGLGSWVTIAAPRRRFDLLTLQQGTTAFVGAGQLPAGQYRAVRLVIDADSSAIILKNGLPAVVNWQGTGEIALYALVEGAVDVPAEGADIVIDFDVGRSFLYDFFGSEEFTLLPWVRAVNAATTGAITGTVTSRYSGPVAPIRNANVSVYRGDPLSAEYTWSLVATGRTDTTGNYTVAFLLPATYIVRIEQPLLVWLQPVVVPNVTVTVGGTATASVELLEVGANGGLTIMGPTQVTVGGSIGLTAVVVDSQGQPVSNPTVAWRTDTGAVISLTASNDSAVVTGLAAGMGRVIATSGAVADTATITVLGSALPVETVAVEPATRTLAIGDSVYFTAVLKDSTGTTLSGRPVSWFTSDASVLRIDFTYDVYVLVRALKAGSVTLTATSEGKTGTSAVTVQ